MSLFDKRLAKDFDDCLRTGNTGFLEGYIEASLELAAADGHKLGDPAYAKAVADDIVKLIKVWKREVGCCGLARGMLAAMRKPDDAPVA